MEEGGEEDDKEYADRQPGGQKCQKCQKSNSETVRARKFKFIVTNRFSESWEIKTAIGGRGRRRPRRK